MKSNEFLKRIVGVVCGFCVSACMLWGLAANAAPNPLLGVQPGYPDIFYISGSGQGCTYSSGSPGTLTITSQPQYVTFTAGGTPQFITGGLLTITATIDASGTFFSGTFIVSGVVGANGSQLLTGTVTSYGIADLAASGGTDRMDFLMSATGGSLVTNGHISNGASVGAIVTMENSTYGGSFGAGWACGVAKGDIGPIPVVGGGSGTGTIGYWKNHASAWPVTSLTLGNVNVTYNQSALLAILDMAVKGDKSIALAKQLIAAKLNVAAGNTSSCISGTISAADQWLINHLGVASGQKQWDGGDVLHDDLDAYNNGELCAPPRP